MKDCPGSAIWKLEVPKRCGRSMMVGRRSSTNGDEPGEVGVRVNARFWPCSKSGSIRAFRIPKCNASPAVAQALSPRPCHTGPSPIPQAKPELYELEIEGRSRVSEDDGLEAARRDFHGPASR